MAQRSATASSTASSSASASSGSRLPLKRPRSSNPPATAESEKPQKCRKLKPPPTPRARSSSTANDNDDMFSPRTINNKVSTIAGARATTLKNFRRTIRCGTPVPRAGSLRRSLSTAAAPKGSVVGVRCNNTSRTFLQTIGKGVRNLPPLEIPDRRLDEIGETALSHEEDTEAAFAAILLESDENTAAKDVVLQEDISDENGNHNNVIISAGGGGNLCRLQGLSAISAVRQLAEETIHHLSAMFQLLQIPQPDKDGFVVGENGQRMLAKSIPAMQKHIINSIRRLPSASVNASFIDKAAKGFPSAHDHARGRELLIAEARENAKLLCDDLSLGPGVVELLVAKETRRIDKKAEQDGGKKCSKAAAAGSSRKRCGTGNSLFFISDQLQDFIKRADFGNAFAFLFDDVCSLETMQISGYRDPKLAIASVEEDIRAAAEEENRVGVNTDIVSLFGYPTCPKHSKGAFGNSDLTMFCKECQARKEGEKQVAAFADPRKWLCPFVITRRIMHSTLLMSLLTKYVTVNSLTKKQFKARIVVNDLMSSVFGRGTNTKQMLRNVPCEITTGDATVSFVPEEWSLSAFERLKQKPPGNRIDENFTNFCRHDLITIGNFFKIVSPPKDQAAKYLGSEKFFRISKALQSFI